MKMFIGYKEECIFLYADLISNDELSRREAYFKELRFKIIRNTDITSNVLLSMNEQAVSKKDSTNTKVDIFNEIMYLPASLSVKGIKDGLAAYRIYNLV